MRRILQILGLLVALTAVAWGVLGARSSEELTAMRKAVAALPAYEVVMTTHEVKGGKTDDVTVRFAWRAPGWVRTEVLQGRHKGAVALYDPDKRSIRAKKPGLPAVSLSPDASMARSLRGERIYEAGFGEMLRSAERLLAQGEVRREARTRVGGREADVLLLASLAPVEPGAVAAERWALDTQTHLPLQRTRVDSQGAVLANTTYTELVMSPTFPADHFTAF